MHGAFACRASTLRLPSDLYMTFLQNRLELDAGLFCVPSGVLPVKVLFFLQVQELGKECSLPDH